MTGPLITDPAYFASLAATVQEEIDRSLRKHGTEQHITVGGGRPDNRAAAERAQAATDQATVDGTVTWEMILREELEEAFAETDPEKIRTELVQVAAVALKIIGQLDTTSPAPLTPEDLKTAKVGTTVQATQSGTYWRKGARDTWHPINPDTGERAGMRNAVQSHYLGHILGTLVTARLSATG